MIEKIRNSFDGQKFSSIINNENVDTSFGSGPLIVYGIPRSGGIDRFERTSPSSRTEHLVKYGIPDSTDSEMLPTPEDGEDIDNEPIVKYGLPDISDDISERKPLSNLPEPEVPFTQEEKPSYFKRLWFAILGKDC